VAHRPTLSVARQPVRASRRSARWCLDCVNVVWDKPARRIRETERPAAAAAWDHARATYQKIISECAAD
jgi:N-methylcarbamate hydrolase